MPDDPKWVWDFSNAKGCGATVVPFRRERRQPEPLVTPHRARPRAVTPYVPKRRKFSEMFLDLGVSQLDAAATIDRLCRSSRGRIPHDLRVAVADLTIRRTGNRTLADRILHGDHDDHLVDLLPHE